MMEIMWGENSIVNEVLTSVFSNTTEWWNGPEENLSSGILVPFFCHLGKVRGMVAPF